MKPRYHIGEELTFTKSMQPVRVVEHTSHGRYIVERLDTQKRMLVTEASLTYTLEPAA